MNTDAGHMRIAGAGGQRPARACAAASRVLDTLTHPVALLAVAVVIAVALARVIAGYLAGLDGVLDPTGEVVTGDFLNFYTGGRVLLSGAGHELYDLQTQLRVQDLITGPGYALEHHFANPPLWAIALAPLCALPFVKAFYLFDAAMVAAMVAALWVLRPHLPAIARDRRRWWAAVLLVLTFHPIARTMFGGQNTPLTFLLLAATYAALRSGRTIRAGLLLGLLSYKPQFLVVLLPALAVQRSFRTLAAAAVVFAGHYLLGALFCGADWPARMLQYLSSYQVSEAQHNHHLHISLVAVFGHALRSPWSLVAGAGSSAVVLAVGLWRARGAALDSPRFAALWGLLVCCTLLASPHAQYYDAGLVALAVLLGLEWRLQRGLSSGAALKVLLIAGYLLYPVYPLVSLVGFQPLVLWPALTLCWLARETATSGACVAESLRPEHDHGP